MVVAYRVAFVREVQHTKRAPCWMIGAAGFGQPAVERVVGDADHDAPSDHGLGGRLLTDDILWQMGFPVTVVTRGPVDGLGHVDDVQRLPGLFGGARSAPAEGSHGEDQEGQHDEACGTFGGAVGIEAEVSFQPAAEASR